MKTQKMKINTVEERRGRPRKRIRSDKYRSQCYVLSNATIERLKASVERGKRSEFVNQAIHNLLDEWGPRECTPIVPDPQIETRMSENPLETIDPNTGKPRWVAQFKPEYQEEALAII